MKRILKNISRNTVQTIYHGRVYVIKSKGSLSLDHDGQDEQAADYLLQTYGFLQDITPKPKVTKLPVKTAYVNRNPQSNRF